MAEPKENSISVKEYNEVSKYKELEKNKKRGHLKTTTVPVIAGYLCMIQKGTDTHINKVLGSLGLRWWNG